MNKVYKYDLEITDYPVVKMPLFAKVLTVREQHGCARLWALVDLNFVDVDHRFRLVGTGHPVNLSELGEHIDTFFIHGGDLVFHLFHCKR